VRSDRGVPVSTSSQDGRQWGWVGERTAWTTFSRTEAKALQKPSGANGEQRGLVRDLEPGAVYTPPPTSLSRPFPVWTQVSRSQTGSVRYVLPLPLADVKGLRSLTGLANQLHTERSLDQLSRESPALDELDQVVEALIDWVASLHKAGLPAGLLTPESVFWYHDTGPSRSSRIVLVPVDWGFEKSPGGTTPAWFSDEAQGRVWWDEGTEPARICGRPVDKQCDWRTVARILDGVLSPQCRGGRLTHPLTRPEEDKELRHPAFRVLERMLREATTDPNTVKAELQEPLTRLSSFFISVPVPTPPRPPIWRRRWFLASLVVLIASGTGGLAYRLLNRPPPAVTRYCPACHQGTDLYLLLQEFEQAVDAKDEEKKLKIYAQMWTETSEREKQRGPEDTRVKNERACLDEILKLEFPGPGLPRGSGLVKPLTRLNELLKMDADQREAHRIRHTQGKTEKPEFTELERLPEFIKALKECTAASLSVVELIREREEAELAKARRGVVEVFKSDGGAFRDRYGGSDYDTVQKPAFRRFIDLWSELKKVCPEIPKEELPCPSDDADFFK